MRRPVRGDYQITSDYKDHIAAGRYPGNDYVSPDRKIYASFDGKAEVGYDSQVKGRYVEIVSTSGNYKKLNSHFATGTIEIRDGAQVKKGQYLGLMGETGNAVGVHTHDSLWKKTANGWQVIDAEPLYKKEDVKVTKRVIYDKVKIMTPILLTSVRHIPTNIPIRKDGKKNYVRAGRQLEIKEYTEWSNGKKFYRTAYALKNKLQQGFGKSKLRRI